MLAPLRFTVLALAAVFAAGSIHARDMWCDLQGVAPAAVVPRLGQLAQATTGERPQPQREIRTEGLLPGQGLHDVSMKAKGDFPKALSLAHGWRAQRKPEFLSGAREYLLAWASTHEPNFNPIDETEFTQLFEAYAVIRDDLASADRQIVDKWVRKFYDGHLAEMRRREAAKQVQISNWQSHRLKIAAGAAVAMGDTALLGALEPFYQAQLRANIRDDGSIEDFHTRDSIGYAIYSLRQLVEVALVTRAAGVPWAPAGSPAYRRLTSALDWLLPYARGEKQHVEYVNSSFRFDRLRTEAGVKGHENAAWKPAEARDLLWLAAYLDPKYGAVAQRLGQKPSSYLVACRGEAPTK